MDRTSNKSHGIYIYNQAVTVVIMLGLAAVYFGTSKLGFTMAYAAKQVTLVWPPSGIALAAVLLFGYRIWPGIALGAFLTNFTADEPFLTAAGIALGNTLEALSGAWMLHRFTDFDNHISHLKDVVALLFLSALISTMISATVGVTSLCLGGVQPWAAFGSLWPLWWLGDASGTLIMAPLLLVWGSRPYSFPARHIVAEGVILAILLTLACMTIFTKPWIIGNIRGDTFIYIVFPFIIWAALRFGQYGTSFVTLTASGIAIWATVHGFGPFIGASVEQSLMLLQVFMAVVAVTGLFLGAAIAERKLASETQSLLASIVESSEDAIISKTPSGVITSWNKGAEHLFGYTAAEAIGQPITFIVPPERQDEEVDILRRLHQGEHIDHYETVRITREGKPLTVSLTISPIQDTAGHIIGTSKVVRDITERKQTEKALREADQRKDEFLALLAHELRNPLAALYNALCILQLPKASKIQHAEAREIMERQLQQMTRLVDDLLDVSRISHGKVELHKQRVMLSEAIHNAIETGNPLIEARKHTLTVRLPENPIWLEADLVRLSQIFANLLLNAAKYTPSGGKIWLEAEAKGAMVEIRVRDTGIGIPATMLSKIFELFTQVDRTIERAQGGMGLGLTLVKSFTEMHHGTVEVRSKGINQGSEFIIQLPQAEPPPIQEGTATTSTHDTEATDKKLRVLIVEDGEALAKTLGWMVELLGHEARIVYNGPDALAIAPSYKPHVVLLDLGLPGMSGYDVCRQMRADPALKHCMLVAQSGWGQPEYRERSKEMGFDKHLVKPVQLHVLEELLLSVGRLPE